MIRKVLAALALLMAAACSQQPPADPPPMSGTHDVVQVKDLVFITSADHSELRVLGVGGEQPGFISAPNPLEPLSIPVVDRPIGLASDLRYGADGQPIGGPFLYAIGAGAAEISVVYAAKADDAPSTPVAEDPLLLTELKRIPTPGPVTALAGRGPLLSSSSTVYFATYDGAAGSLWQMELPASGELRNAEISSLQGTTRLLLSLPGEAIAAVLVLPNPSELAVATRGDSGRTGQVVVLDTATQVQRPLRFPGPVRRLATHGAAGGLGAGARIFGILEDEACGGGPACSGVIAVDAATGEVALDVTGQPMVPLGMGDGLVLDLSLGTDIRVNAGGTVEDRALVGGTTTSTGTTTFFDAFQLRHFDFDPLPASVRAIAFRGPPTGEGPDGAELPYVDGPIQSSIAVADGAARDETILLVFQGVLPGLAELPTSDADGQRFPVPVERVGLVAPGDLVIVSTPSGVCGELSVTSVDPSGAALTDVPPPACTGRTSFSLRAGGAKPYVVSGGRSGHMGRTGPGDAFRFAGSYFHHPDGFDPSVPQLRFDFGAGPQVPERESRYVIELEDAFVPFTTFPDRKTVCQGATLLHFPSAVVLDSPRDQAYVAYPSGNTVLVIPPGDVGPGSSAANVLCYR